MYLVFIFLYCSGFYALYFLMSAWISTFSLLQNRIVGDVSLPSGAIAVLERATENLARARGAVRSDDVPAFWNTSRDVATFNVISGRDRNYFYKVNNVSEIKTVGLYVAWKDVPSVIYPRYYPTTSNDCRLLKTASKLGNVSCTDNATKAFSIAHPVLPAMLSKGLPSSFSASHYGDDDVVLLTYIHLITQAFVHKDDDVYANSTEIVPQRCRCKEGENRKSLRPLRIRSFPLYEEVFTIAQFWGSGFFHSTLENLPRLAPYISYLRRNPHIKIHALARHPFLPLLGLDPGRIVSGNVRAKILYMPAGGPCGNPPVFSTQMLSLQLRPNPHNTDQRNNIILIKRSRKRWFKRHDSILKMMETMAQPLGFYVSVFADKPLPGLNLTRELFATAFLVVAPHGAGEANLLFSRPGTVLMEGLCYAGGKINLCYKSMAETLGLRYHGLVFKKSCMDITPEEIAKPFQEVLEMKRQGLLWRYRLWNPTSNVN